MLFGNAITHSKGAALFVVLMAVFCCFVWDGS